MKARARTLSSRISHMDAHHKLYASLAVAGIAFFVCYGFLELPMAAMVTWPLLPGHKSFIGMDHHTGFPSGGGQI